MAWADDGEEINIAGVPGNTGIVGNERVDREAKATLLNIHAGSTPQLCRLSCTGVYG